MPPPVYAPDLVANAILHAAEHPQREVPVGGASKMFSMGAALSPRLMDLYQEATSFRQQKTDQPARRNRDGSLYQPSHDLAERMALPRHVFESSTYNAARRHPMLTGAALVGAGLALGGIWAALSSREGNGA